MATIFVILFMVVLVLGIVFDVFGSIQSKTVSIKRGVPYYLASVVFLLLAMSYTEVDAGSVGVVKRFGNPVRQADPGLHFILPVIETMTTIPVQTRIVKPNEDASSRDLQIVHTEVTLAYHVDPAYATFVLVNLNADAENRVINPAIFEAIKATTAQYDVQELITQRPLVRDGIENFVRTKLAQYHIIAETTSITDFRFSDEFEKAIEAKVTAQQHAEQATNDLKRIEIEANQKIAQAKGEAEALRSQKEQITPELLALRTIEMMDKHWDGHLPNNWVSTGAGRSALPMFDVLQGAGK